MDLPRAAGNPPTAAGLRSEPAPRGRAIGQRHDEELQLVAALEGDVDTSHLGFLHSGAIKPETARPGSFGYYTVADRSPRYMAIDTDYGAMYGAYRPAEPGYLYWRVAQFLFPFYTQIPTGILGHQVLSRAWVPMDDDHMMFFYMGTRSRVASRTDSQAPAARGLAMRENSTDWYGRHRLLQDAGNDYLIDRAAQRELRSYTGIEGVPVQDGAVTESMGSLLNRMDEHLGSSDMMVIRVRRRLMEAARAFISDKVTPPGVDDPEVYRVRSGGVILPETTDWLEGIADLLPAYREHPELDLTLDQR